MEHVKPEKHQSNWIWGIFYYNKNDDRIFPPKRIPWMGWTVNFAKTKSVVAFLAMMAFFGFVIYYDRMEKISVKLLSRKIGTGFPSKRQIA